MQAERTTAKRLPSPWLFGHGFWWALLPMFGMNDAVLFPLLREAPELAKTGRVIFFAALVAGSLIGFFLWKRLARLYEDAPGLVAAALVVSIGATAGGLSALGVLGESVLFIGFALRGLGASVLMLSWGQTIRAAGIGAAGRISAGALAVLAILNVVTFGLANIAPVAAVVVLGILPLLACTSLLVSRSKIESAAAVDVSMPLRRPRVPTPILATLVIGGVAFGLMLNLTAFPQMIEAPSTWLSVLIPVLGFGAAAVFYFVGLSSFLRNMRVALASRVVLLIVALGILLLPVLTYGHIYVLGAAIAVGWTSQMVLSTLVLADIDARFPGSALVMSGQCGAAYVGGIVVGMLILPADVTPAVLDSVQLSMITVVGVSALLLAGIVPFDEQTNVTLGGERLGEHRTETRDEYLERRSAVVAQVHGLTPRETEILSMLALGGSRDYIRDALFVSTATLKTHIKRIYEKLDVHSHQQLMNLVDEREPSSGRRANGGAE